MLWRKHYLNPWHSAFDSIARFSNPRRSWSGRKNPRGKSWFAVRPMPIHPLTGVATNNCYSIWGRFRTCIYCQQCCQHVSKSGLRKATVITGSQNSTVLSGPTLAKLGRTRFDLRSLYVTTGGALLSPINGAFIELIKSVYPFNDGWNLLYQSSPERLPHSDSAYSSEPHTIAFTSTTYSPCLCLNFVVYLT